MRFLQKLQQPKHVDRESFLIQAATNRRVLHVGCVDSGLLQDRLAAGHFLHSKLEGVAAELWGLDADCEGIEQLRKLGFRNLHDGSAEEPPSEIPRNYFDVLIAGEIIEHLRNAGRFLDSAARLLARDGRIVITTPNALRFYNTVPALLGRELIHPDHLSWYSPHTLRRAVELSPFRIEGMYVYNQIPVAKPRPGSTFVARSTRRAFNLVGPIAHGTLVRLFPYLSDGLVLVAHLDTSEHSREVAH